MVPYFGLKTFLLGRSQQVIVNGYSSNPTNVTGVPQGTVLAPLPFLCYINNLPENVSSKVRLYADDCIVIQYY